MEAYDATNPIIIINALPKNRRIFSQGAKDVYPAGFQLQRAKSTGNEAYLNSLQHRNALLSSILVQKESYISWAHGDQEGKSKIRGSRNYFPSRNHTKSPKGMKDPSWELDAYSSSVVLSQGSSQAAKVPLSKDQLSFMAWTKGRQANDSPKGPENGDPFSDVAGPYYRKKTKEDFDVLPDIDEDAKVELVSRGMVLSTRNSSKPATPTSSQGYRTKFMATPPNLPRLLPIIAVPNGSITNLANSDESLSDSVRSVSPRGKNADPATTFSAAYDDPIVTIAPKRLPDWIYIDIYRTREVVDSTKPAEALRRVTVPSGLQLSGVHKMISDQEAPGDCFDDQGRKMAPDVYFFHPTLNCWRSFKSKSDWAAVKYAALEKEVPLKLMYSYKKKGLREFQQSLDQPFGNPEVSKLMNLDLQGLDLIDRRALGRSLSSPKTCLLEYPPLLSDSPPLSPLAPEAPLVSTPALRGNHLQHPTLNGVGDSPSAAGLLLDMDAPAPGARPPTIGRASRASARNGRMEQLDAGSMSNSISSIHMGRSKQEKVIPRPPPRAIGVNTSTGFHSKAAVKVSIEKQELLALALEKRILKTRW